MNMIGKLFGLICGLLLLQCSTVGSNLHGETCSYWKTTQLDTIPEWYRSALDPPPTVVRDSLSDSLLRTVYFIGDSKTIVHYQSGEHEIWDSAANWLKWIRPGSLYVCNGDTILIDTDLIGFDDLSFNLDSSRCATVKGGYIHEDGGRGDVVMYDLANLKMTMLHLLVASNSAQMQPVVEDPFVAYSDWGDFYIYSTAGRHAELVFSRGGSYAQVTDCSRRFISDIRWSKDGTSVIFKYYPDVGEPEFVLYEVHRTRADKRK